MKQLTYKQLKELTLKEAIEFIDNRKITIAELEKIREDLNWHIDNCKISNTVGNSATIAGAALSFFIPPVGIPLAIGGAATSLGTSFSQWYIERQKHGRLMEVLEKDEKSRNKLVGIIGEIKELAKGTVKIGSTATNLAKAGKSVKLFRETNNLQKITQAALPELNVVANVRTASTQGMSTFGKLNKLSKGSICLSGIGAGLSAYDIYQTWKPNNTPESLKELDEIIESLKKDLENLETRQLEAQIEVSSEWNCRVM